MQNMATPVSSKDMQERIVEMILKDQLQMESVRANYESWWRELALYYGQEVNWFYPGVVAGQNPNHPEVVDSSSRLALDRYVALTSALSHPKGKKFHGLEASDPALNKSRRVKNYFQDVTDVLHRARNNPKSRFYSQAYMQKRMWAMFGSSPMLVDEVYGSHLYYRTPHPREIYQKQNAYGFVDVLHRKFRWPAWKIREFFNRPSDNLPDCIVKDCEPGGNRNNDYEIIHSVRPNAEFEPDSKVGHRKRYRSSYVFVRDRIEMRAGGYAAFPWALNRSPGQPEDDYGIPTALLMLPDAKMVNTVDRQNIKTMQLRNAPPILTHGEGTLRKFKLKPGAIINGGLDAMGKARVQTLDLGIQSEMGMAIAEQRRQAISSAFLNNVYETMIENPNMKATTALAILQERAQILQPVLSMLESEGDGIMIERELEMLDNAGLLPEMPPELVEAGAGYQPVFVSPLAKAQLAEEAYGAEATVQRALGVANVNPDILKEIDFRYYLEITGESENAPSRLFRDPAVVEQEKAAAAQQQQGMVDASTLPAAAGAVLDLAKAKELTDAA